MLWTRSSASSTWWYCRDSRGRSCVSATISSSWSGRRTGTTERGRDLTETSGRGSADGGGGRTYPARRVRACRRSRGRRVKRRGSLRCPLRVPELGQLAEPPAPATLRQAAERWKASRVDVSVATATYHRSPLNRAARLLDWPGHDHRVGYRRARRAARRGREGSRADPQDGDRAVDGVRSRGDRPEPRPRPAPGEAAARGPPGDIPADPRARAGGYRLLASSYRLPLVGSKKGSPSQREQQLARGKVARASRSSADVIAAPVRRPPRPHRRSSECRRRWCDGS